MAPSCFNERAGPDVLIRVTCDSLYSPGSSNVGSVRIRNPAISMSAVGPPMRVILGAFMRLLSFPRLRNYSNGCEEGAAAHLSESNRGSERDGHQIFTPTS